MAILNRLLRLLELLEHISDFTEFLLTSTGLAVVICLVSYQALMLAGCDAASAAVLASVVALALQSAYNQPDD
ncbi:MAG: hypothetical protein AAFX01_04585 [Cyanobacteria bacterium J06638_28]